MNRSGVAVKRLVDKYKVQDKNLYIIHDDLDIRLGEYKIQKGRGPKEHKGVLSVEKELGSKEFWRVRVGIDNRQAGEREEGESYTLKNFRPEEKQKFNKVVEEVADALARMA